jgi:hypothetical protein
MLHRSAGTPHADQVAVRAREIHDQAGPCRPKFYSDCTFRYAPGEDERGCSVLDNLEGLSRGGAGHVGRRRAVAGEEDAKVARHGLARSRLAADTGGDTSVGYVQLVPALIVAGAGVSMAMPAAQNAVFGSVAATEVGKASGVFNMFRLLGGELAALVESS